MRSLPLKDLVSPTGRRAGPNPDGVVYSVTKHDGFVASLEYFKKQVFSRDLTNYKRVEGGDFAYATIHLDEGSIGIAPSPGLISPMYTVFRPDESKVHPGYLLRFLKSPPALAIYAQLGRGAVHRRKAISLSALGTVPIPLPPVPEQRRIAAILDHADALCTKRRLALTYLDSLPQAIFREMFSSNDAKLVRAKSFMTKVRNGLSPATTGEFTADVLTLSAITRGRFDPTSVKSGMFAVKPPVDKHVSATDFLICRGNGNKVLVGAGVYAGRDHPDLVFPDTVIAGKVDQEVISMEYLDAAWRQPAIRRQIEAGARTTNGTYKVNQQVITEIQISLPPLGLQKQFARAVTSLESKRNAALQAVLRHDELFSSLQSRAFRGEL